MANSRVQRTSSWDVFRQDILTLRKSMRGGFRNLINWLFTFTQNGAQRRRTLFVFLSLFLWFMLALLADPIEISQGRILHQFIGALFSFNILRHFLILALALWIGLRLAAIYLDDIFELNDVSVSERFLREAAFSGSTQKVVIKEGRVALNDRDSPLIKIGGPGQVDVHLENAALFEKIDGTPNVVAPTDRRPIVLDGFERLRDVIDLREQTIVLTVEGRSQDGIPIRAEDVRAVYSIYRGRNRPASENMLQQPYRFTMQSVLNLVYTGGRSPLEMVMRSMVRAELSRFISAHTLDEFLTNAEDDPKADGFVPRDEISRNILASIHSKAAKKGVQLHWLGVGTWVTPSEIIPERHMEAWKLSSEVRLKRSEHVLSNIRKESRFGELLRLIDELLAFYFLELERTAPAAQVKRRMASAYREKLIRAKELYEDEPVPKEIDLVIKYLNVVAARWVSGDKSKGKPEAPEEGDEDEFDSENGTPVDSQRVDDEAVYEQSRDEEQGEDDENNDEPGDEKPGNNL